MQINYRKSLKFLTLLITAILIGSVSAEVYRYMYIEGTISVTGAKLVWLEGADVDSTITGSTAIFTLNVEEGTPVNFTEALFLKNTNGTGSFNYNITITQALSSSDFERANMYIYENYTSQPSWTHNDTLNLTNINDYSSGALAAGNYLRMTIEVNATNTNGGTFKVRVEYWAP